MSSSYRFDLATEADDGALRAILKNTSMPGEISLSFQREPSFFAAERAGNLCSQVIAARETASGAIVGLASRSFRKMFIDGEVAIGGYLSNLRGMPQVRGGPLLARGYRFLKDLHGDGRTPFYVTTILDGNDNAKELLTSRRAGLPVYHPLGRLHTYLIPLYKWRRLPSQGPTSQGPKVIKGMSGDQLAAAVANLNSHNRRHQFGPCYTSQDLKGDTQLLPGFSPKNLYGYQGRSGLTATLGVWDQTSFKQSVVTDYSRRYRLARPLFDIGALFGVTLKLPKIGRPFPYLYGAFLSHAPGCEKHLETLLLAALKDWSRRGYTYLMIGAHERSPLTSMFQRYAAGRKSSMAYLVYWEDSLKHPLPSAALIPHLEIATL